VNKVLYRVILTVQLILAGIELDVISGFENRVSVFSANPADHLDRSDWPKWEKRCTEAGLRSETAGQLDRVASDVDKQRTMSTADASTDACRASTTASVEFQLTSTTAARNQ